jgi:glutamate dehydrogenase/leucine dehydrogenase
MGRYAHKLANLVGLNVIGVSDSRGGAFNSKGLSYEEISKFKREP